MPDIQATYSALSQIPQVLQEVRTGVDMLKTLGNAPAAMAATGSAIASAAIAALSAELAYLLADVVKAVDDDIDGMLQVQNNYRNSEDIVTQLAAAGTRLLSSASRSDRPRLGGGAIDGCFSID